MLMKSLATQFLGGLGFALIFVYRGLPRGTNKGEADWVSPAKALSSILSAPLPPFLSATDFSL